MITEDDKNELKFMASRNKLKAQLLNMADFIRASSPEKIGKARYENLREVAALGLMLIMENEWQYRQIDHLRKDLNAEMRMNTELIRKHLDGET